MQQQQNESAKEAERNHKMPPPLLEWHNGTMQTWPCKITMVTELQCCADDFSSVTKIEKDEIFQQKYPILYNKLINEI